MNWVIFGGVVAGVAVLGFLMQRFGLIDVVGNSRAKSAGNGAGLIGIGDEVFAPARHEAAMELDRQTILPAPAPLAGDPLARAPRRGGAGPAPKGTSTRGVYDGRITIDLRRTS